MKKRNILLIIGILILLSLALNVEAGAGENLGRWLDNHLFEPTGRLFDRDIRGLSGVPFYDDYAQLIDFVIFLILFISISSIALNKAFKGESYKEARNAIKALAIIIGIALALAALKAGLSVTFFIPFVTNALFFIALMVVYFLLLRMGMDKHKILAFILAIIITYLLFNLAGIAMGRGEGLKIGKGDGFKLPSLPTGGLKKIGLFGEDCDDVLEKLEKTTIELENVRNLVNERKTHLGFSKDEEITLNKLYDRYDQLKLSGENDTQEKEIKKYYNRWKQVKGYVEKWEERRKKCEKEGKLPKAEDKDATVGERPPVEKKEGFFTVYVFDEKGENVEEAKVILLQDDKEIASKTTNKDGKAEFGLQLVGDYQLKAEKEGYETKTTIKIRHTKETTHHFVLSKIPTKEEVEEVTGKVELKAYKIINVYNVVSIDDDKYRGYVKYKNISSGKEHDVLYTFNSFGSLDDISKQWFAESLGLNQASEEFKNLEQDIRNLAIPLIAKLKVKAEEEEVTEAKPPTKEEVGEVKKGLGTGAKIGIGGGAGLALLLGIVFFLKRRKGKKAEAKAEDVQKETEKMSNKIKKLSELFQEKKDKIVSLEKNAEGGFIKNA